MGWVLYTLMYVKIELHIGYVPVWDNFRRLFNSLIRFEMDLTFLTGCEQRHILVAHVAISSLFFRFGCMWNLFKFNSGGFPILCNTEATEWLKNWFTSTIRSSVRSYLKSPKIDAVVARVIKKKKKLRYGIVIRIAKSYLKFQHFPEIILLNFLQLPSFFKSRGCYLHSFWP